IGHYDAGNLRGSTLFLPTPASYSNSWDAFITFSLCGMVACACGGGYCFLLSPGRENGAGVRLRAWWVMIVAESFNGYKGLKL
ncbi:hypothetical protein NEL75_11405, partial [Escherichia coli]|nr:hypothetical protein [Escherichia coli]